MDVQQFFKRDHAKMSGLFDKLAETSDAALKTRERLFDDLKIEIEAHRAVVEDRLYPLLRKHKETRDLKPTARELNQIERQLRDVERLEKSDPQFLAKVRELKKTMESQLREEERHIVPALKKALEPEAFEELARELAEGKREEQQEIRERLQGAEDSDQQPGTPTQSPGAQQLIREMSEAGRTGARSLLEEQQRVTRAAADAARASAERSSDLVARQVDSAAAVSRRVVGSAHDAQRALADGVMEGLRVNAEAWSASFRCGNVVEFSSLQGRLLAQWAKLQADTGSRLLEATQRAVLGLFVAEEDEASRRH